MQVVVAIVAFLAGVDVAVAQPRWHLDLGGAALREAWDLNGATESLTGVAGGVDRRVWRGVAVRSELVALRVHQSGVDVWMHGVTIGTRMRWHRDGRTPFIDVAVGVSNATAPVPPHGTAFNYLALAGGGLEIPAGDLVLSVTGRWLHASNNGRQGRHLNPDVQALGAIVGVGWEF